MPHTRARTIGLALLCALFWGAAGHAATWTADVTFTVERTTEISDTEPTTHEDTFDQSYNLSYETNLLENLEFTLDLTLDVEQTEDDPGYITRDTKPSVEVTLVAEWWDLSASWDETKTTNTDPAEGRTVDTEWEFEAVVEPEYEALPAFSYDIQGGNDDVTDTDIEAVLEYSFLEKLDLTLGVSRETTDDPEPDADTDGRTIEAELKLTHDFTPAIAFEADWSMDRDQSLALTDEGEVLAREDTLTNDLTVTAEWNVLDQLTATLERELNWDKDLEVDTLEATSTWTGELEYDRDVTEALHLNLSYSDEREDDRPLDANTYTITRDYTAELEFAPYDWLSITPSFDRSDKVQWSEDAETGTDKTLDDTYEIALDYTLWEEFLVLEVTRTWDLSWENGSQTAEDRSWEVDVDLLPGHIPNLEVKPSYSYTQDLDLVAETADKEAEVEVEFIYELTLGDRVTVTLDHTYTRTQDWPDDAKMTIERDDDTEFTLTWDEFLRGMSAEYTWNRDASDTSEDDQEPEVDFTYSITYDWEFLANYTFSVEFNRDIKQESEDTQDVTTTFSAEFYDGRITLDLEHEFDEQLEGERTETHRYLIELTGEF